MMRGVHLDLCVPARSQVSAAGDLASWHMDRPEDIPALRGGWLWRRGQADFVMMDPLTREGTAKIIPTCTSRADAPNLTFRPGGL
jgi:acyl CoA:acetate/3-ketoacid CoA transferase beta subunit